MLIKLSNRLLFSESLNQIDQVVCLLRVNQKAITINFNQKFKIITKKSFVDVMLPESNKHSNSSMGFDSFEDFNVSGINK